MSRTTGKKSKVRKANDFYKTPQWCIDGILHVLHHEFQWHPFEGDDVFQYDLGAGDGRIGRTIFPWFRRPPGEGKSYEYFIDINKPETDTGDENWVIGDYKDLVQTNKGHEKTIYVSNPPFSASEEFVYKAVADLEGREDSLAIFLLRLNWLGSKHRAEWINKHPPCKVLVLAPRPSFNKVVTIDKDGKKRTSNTDACEYAWFFWANNYVSNKPFEVYTRKD